VVGRFGGEEFVVLLPRADADEAIKIAERLRHRASVMGVYADGVTLDVTISIGLAVLGTHGQDLFELLAAADLALYRAKAEGRDQVRVYAPDDATRLGRRAGQVPLSPPAAADASKNCAEDDDEAEDSAA
jgi:predicted signal transduction protein with EAL and GGDEF domain